MNYRVQLWLSLLVLTAGSGCATTRQPPLAAPGISVQEKVMLGGLRQTIFIRGRDVANPVLLFLHGGPGFPEMPFSHVNAELERDFTVVHWDQRGAGKSYQPDIPAESMRVEEFVRETGELTRHLRARFGQRKIYLVGFSFGSLVGILAAAEHPEYYRAYVGISQLVDVAKSNRLLYEAALDRADGQGAVTVARGLREIGAPPYAGKREKRRANALAAKIERKRSNEVTGLRGLALFLRSPYYSIFDIPRTLRGLRFSNRALHDGIYARRLEEQLPEVEVPVWFFLARYDRTLSAPLAAAYFRELRAPQGKHLVWFEQSGHPSNLEEPGRFYEEMQRVKAATGGGDSGR